jgi:hypothetical protein
VARAARQKGRSVVVRKELEIKYFVSLLSYLVRFSSSLSSEKPTFVGTVQGFPSLKRTFRSRERSVEANQYSHQKTEGTCVKVIAFIKSRTTVAVTPWLDSGAPE